MIKFIPRHDEVLIRAPQVQEKTRGGIIKTDIQKLEEKLEADATKKFEVIAMSKAIASKGDLKIGDMVLLDRGMLGNSKEAKEALQANMYTFPIDDPDGVYFCVSDMMIKAIIPN